MSWKAEEEDDLSAQSSTNWTAEGGNTKNYHSTETTRTSLTTQPTAEVGATPTMPKKVSFAAEVDEQQEKMSKENARRDACCSIQ